MKTYQFYFYDNLWQMWMHFNNSLTFAFAEEQRKKSYNKTYHILSAAKM